MTETINHILVATDYLESSRLSLDYAVAMAHSFGAALTLLHAIELSTAAEEAEALTRAPSVSRKEAELRLEGFAAGIRRTGLTVHTKIIEGAPDHVILNATVSMRPDLLVLGTHGEHSGLSHLFLGSNAEKVVLSVGCPTLTVGNHVRAGVDFPLRVHRILYLSDGSQSASEAAALTRLFQQKFSAAVDAYEIYPSDVLADSVQCDKLAEEFRKSLEASMPGDLPAWLHHSRRLDFDHCVDEILPEIRKGGFTLIVLGVNPVSRLERHLHPSLPYQLIARASCPVVTVRALPQEGDPLQ